MHRRQPGGEVGADRRRQVAHEELAAVLAGSARTRAPAPRSRGARRPGRSRPGRSARSAADPWTCRAGRCPGGGPGCRSGSRTRPCRAAPASPRSAGTRRDWTFSSLSPPFSPGAISCSDPGTPSQVTRRTPGVSNPSRPPSSDAAAARTPALALLDAHGGPEPHHGLAAHGLEHVRLLGGVVEQDDLLLVDPLADVGRSCRPAARVELLDRWHALEGLRAAAVPAPRLGRRTRAGLGVVAAAGWPPSPGPLGGGDVVPVRRPWHPRSSGPGRGGGGVRGTNSPGFVVASGEACSDGRGGAGCPRRAVRRRAVRRWPCRAGPGAVRGRRAGRAASRASGRARASGRRLRRRRHRHRLRRRLRCRPPPSPSGTAGVGAAGRGLRVRGADAPGRRAPPRSTRPCGVELRLQCAGRGRGRDRGRRSAPGPGCPRRPAAGSGPRCPSASVRAWSSATRARSTWRSASSARASAATMPPVS